MVKLLLTSSGISNDSIHNALVELLGKPISECNALCIPTAIYPFPGGPAGAYNFIAGKTRSPMCDLGWKSLGVLELTALPSIPKEFWTTAVREADALLVWGGNVLYLRHWMRESGLAELLPSLDLVYVGVSAGSMVTATLIGETFTDFPPLTGSDIQSEEVVVRTPEGEPLTVHFTTAPGLGLADFSLFPHVGHERFPENSLDHVETWAAKMGVSTYALDDQTAIKVSSGAVEIISEGNWKLFAPGSPTL